MQVPFRIVVEPQEVDEYANGIARENILALPFSNLGQGSIPARNWIWQHAIAEGHKRHWIMDDNIRAFRRQTREGRIELLDGTAFRVCETFVERYTNVALAGLRYRFHHVHGPPVYFNTRIYSCILILNELRQRWRGRYNEDTDLSLRVLKEGWCTVLFAAFMIDKQATMTMKGGNTDHLYKQNASFDGRLEMARSLQRQHPDVTRVTRKWGRWQHTVNYRPFRGNKLQLVDGVVVSPDVDEFGLQLVRKQ